MSRRESLCLHALGWRARCLLCLLCAACWHEDVHLGGHEPANVGDGEASFADACGGDAYSVRRTQLELLVLLDNSLSMALPAIGFQCVASVLSDCSQNAAGVIPSFWEIALRELRTFMSDERSAGVAMALTYFGDACSAEAYVTPDVPMGTLPDHALSIGQSLDTTLPFAETATRPALEGGMTFLAKRAREPGYEARPVVLLITDGLPDAEDCTDNTTQSASQVAALALQASPSVMTYVFVTAPGLSLDEIALAGGTQRSLPGDLSRIGALSTALSLVRDREVATLPCSYDLPPAYFTQNEEPDRVNLTIDGVPLHNVETSARCSPKLGGWYYDDPAQPQRILACPSSCEQLKRAGSVEIVLKCATVVPS